MGLDMYLKGNKFFASSEKPRETEDGFEVTEHVLELGYWRKHPNLHGFIVKHFAEGVDDCKPIELEAERLEVLIEAVRTRDLPETEGFFFGSSDGTEWEEDLRILSKALAWLKQKQSGVWKSVVYQASW